MEKGSEREKGSRTQVGSKEFSFNREDSFIRSFNRQGLGSFCASGFAPGHLA